MRTLLIVALAALCLDPANGAEFEPIGPGAARTTGIRLAFGADAFGEVSTFKNEDGTITVRAGKYIIKISLDGNIISSSEVANTFTYSPEPSRSVGLLESEEIENLNQCILTVSQKIAEAREMDELVMGFVHVDPQDLDAISRILESSDWYDSRDVVSKESDFRRRAFSRYAKVIARKKWEWRKLIRSQPGSDSYRRAEVYNQEWTFPFGLGGIQQKRTFYPSKSAFDRVRDETLTILRLNGPVVNALEGPWVHVETRAERGFDPSGILPFLPAFKEGREYKRSRTAAEAALDEYLRELR